MDSIIVHCYGTRNQVGYMTGLGLCAALLLNSGVTGVKTTPDVNQQMEFELATGVAGQTVELRTDLTGWETTNYKLQETEPGVYTIRIPKPWYEYSLEYKFLINGTDWMLDPKNPKKTPNENGGFNSVHEVRFQESRLLKPLPENKIWNTQTLDLDSPSGPRKIFVLTPPFKTDKPLATLYLNDGADYLRQAELPLILANYYELGGEPFIAVLISHTKERFTEYGSVAKNSYDKWVSESLIPKIEAKYAVSKTPKDRIIMGSSMGGLAALRTGFYSGQFGSVVVQSGSLFYPSYTDKIGPPEKLEDILDHRVHTPRLWSSIGSFEGDLTLEANRRFPAQLATRGIPAQTIETPAKHDWINWRNQFEVILSWVEQR